jgi:6-phosphogluconolactonase
MWTLIANIATFFNVVSVAVVLTAIPTQAKTKTFVYVSNAEDGDIDGYLMDEASGRLTPLVKTAAGRLVMPMTLSPDKRFLYAAVRSKPYTVNTYAIDPATGALKLAAKTPPLADNKVHLSTDATGRYMFSASIAGHNISVSALSATGLAETEPFQVIPFSDRAHCILADRSNRFVYAINFGEAKINQYRFNADNGQLTPNDPAAIGAGSGPRLMTLSPDNKFLYLLDQVSGYVTQFAIDPTKGTLTKVGDTPSVPSELGLQPGIMKANGGEAISSFEDEGGVPHIWASDIHITPDGRFLYATERRSNRILLLSIAPRTGKTTYVANFETEKQPRAIGIDPSGKYLVASGEKSDHLSVYRIGKADGRLSLVDRFPGGKGANWVEIVNIPQ